MNNKSKTNQNPRKITLEAQHEPKPQEVELGRFRGGRMMGKDKSQARGEENGFLVGDQRRLQVGSRD